MTRLLWIATMVVAMCFFARAEAAPSQQTTEGEKQARKSFQSAEAHFKAGSFVEALEDYKAGYDLYPLPGFLINIAQCQRRLGDLEKARATYRKFVMVAPDSSYVPEVNAMIAELDRLIGELESSPSTSLAEKAPPPLAPSAAPPAEGQINLKPAFFLEESSTTPAEPPRSGTRWWLWGTVGAVTVAGVVTAVLLLRSPGTTVIHDGSLGTLGH